MCCVCIINIVTNNMNLLKIDNKLIAVCTKSLTSYNITDNLDGHIIRKIIVNSYRMVILTVTNLYYLYVTDEFVLVDVTECVFPYISGNIQFIVNYDAIFNNIVIITDDDVVYVCETYIHKVTPMKLISKLEGKQIVAVSNKQFSYIYKCNDGYIMDRYNSWGQIVQHCVLDGIPSNFLTPFQYLHNNAIFKYRSYNEPIDVIRDVSHMYNEDYCVKNNIVYNTDDLIKYTNGDLEHCYNVCATGYNKLIDIKHDYKIVLDGNHNVLLLHTYMIIFEIEFIAKSYYCADSIGQYSNDTVGVVWSANNHCMFDEYTRKIVYWVMLCYKYGGVRMFIPKGVLFMILGYVVK